MKRVARSEELDNQTEKAHSVKTLILIVIEGSYEYAPRTCRVLS